MPTLPDLSIDAYPIIKAYADAFAADATIAGLGVYIGSGDAAPQNVTGPRIGIKMPSAVLDPAYGENTVRAVCDFACTTEGRDVSTVYGLALAVQKVITNPVKAAYVVPSGYHPITAWTTPQVIPRDPPPEAGKTVRVLVVSVTIWAEKV